MCGEDDDMCSGGLFPNKYCEHWLIFIYMKSKPYEGKNTLLYSLICMMDIILGI